MFTEGQQGNPIGDFGAPPRPTGIRRAMQSLGLMSRIGIIGASLSTNEPRADRRER